MLLSQKQFALYNWQIYTNWFGKQNINAADCEEFIKKDEYRDFLNSFAALKIELSQEMIRI